jgi:hypothetical protein
MARTLSSQHTVIDGHRPGRTLAQLLISQRRSDEDMT